MDKHKPRKGDHASEAIAAPFGQEASDRVKVTQERVRAIANHVKTHPKAATPKPTPDEVIRHVRSKYYRGDCDRAETSQDAATTTDGKGASTAGKGRIMNPNRYQDAVKMAEALLSQRMKKKPDCKMAAQAALSPPPMGWPAFLKDCAANGWKTWPMFVEGAVDDWKGWPAFLKDCATNKWKDRPPYLNPPATWAEAKPGLLTKDDSRAWQVQTLMYQSGVIVYPREAGGRWFIPAPSSPPFWFGAGTANREILDGLRGQVDSEGKPYLHYTGERAGALVEKALGDPTLWDRLTTGMHEEPAKKPKRDPLAWEAACNLAAAMLQQGDALPPRLVRFVIGVLRDPNSRPKRQGQNSADRLVRDAAFACTVHEMKEIFGYAPITRNDATGHGSVCDAVAEAARNLGLGNTTYITVRKIWDRRHRRL